MGGVGHITHSGGGYSRQDHEVYYPKQVGGVSGWSQNCRSIACTITPKQVGVVSCRCRKIVNENEVEV